MTEIHFRLLITDYKPVSHPDCQSTDYKKPIAEKNSHKKEEFPNQQIILADPRLQSHDFPVYFSILLKKRSI